jgi:molybdate/tungstate transport system permease protein
MLNFLKFRKIQAAFWLLGAVLLFLLIFPIIKIVLGSDIGILSETMQDRQVLDSILLTLECALYATLLALVLGVGLAYFIARFDFMGKSFIEAAISIPIIIPHTAAGIALLTVFSNKFFFGKCLASVGLTVIDSKLGIVLGMFFVSAPFLINSAIQAFNSYDPKVERVARTLGASFGQTFCKISLPLAKDGIIKGAIMMWARGISEFGAVVILAYHPMIAPALVFERFQAYGLKYSKPVAALLIIICLIIFSILTVIGNKNAKSKKYM